VAVDIWMGGRESNSFRFHMFMFHRNIQNDPASIPYHPPFQRNLKGKKNAGCSNVI
jgi:hypothetical protein